MPLADPAPARHPSAGPALGIDISPSAAVELYWATALSDDGSFYSDHPLLDELASSHGRLMQRISRLWGYSFASCTPGKDCRVSALPEVLVLADRTGALASSDFEELLGALAEAAPRRSAPPRLGSEPAADRKVIRDRLTALAADARLRRSWLGVLADVAAELSPRWVQIGRAVSQRACRARSSQLTWNDDLSVIRQWASSDYGGLLDKVLERAVTENQAVQVVPSYLSGRGMLFDLPRHVLLGVPAQAGPKESRARAEPLARSLKALSDPTRLAIADYLVAAPHTVGELASDFGLAQPTVSRHIQILREAGLLAEVRQGSSVLLSADQDAIALLMSEVSSALVTRASR